MSLPDSIQTVAQLEDLLSEPTAGVVETLGRLEGDLIVLGAGGKMGPSLCRMARRASDAAGAQRRVIGVSRFSSDQVEAQMRADGVETIQCDLLNADALAALPEATNVVYMAGRKFGSKGNEPLTWAMNTHLPALVAQRFRRSRIVAFSTALYGFTPVNLGGPVETDPPNPAGEYYNSCLGRERIFQHFSGTLGIPMTLIRLSYANELRYGVLLDVAKKVWAGASIDVAMGHAHVIWQGDASAMALASFDHVADPPRALNVTGPDLVSIREVAEQFSRLLDRPATFTGEEAPDALLCNAALAHRLFGLPRVSVDRMILWIADWVRRGGDSLGKPTHYEVRDGKF
jgi:uncharacterized protein YbjT (DUF2867 family)